MAYAFNQMSNPGDQGSSVRDLPVEKRQALLRAKLDEMWENNEIPTWITHGSHEEAATAVLDLVAPLSRKYHLEIYGHIVPNEKGYRFTRPQVGHATGGALNTSHMGYHTHPGGSLVFSNRDTPRPGGDADWVRDSGKRLYLGIQQTRRGPVGIAVCEPGNCPRYGRDGAPGRTIRGF